MPIAELISALVDLYMLAILARAVLSWVNPGWRHPVGHYLRVLTEPVLQPIRGMLPQSGTFDFSPVVALFVLSLIRRLIA